MSRDRARQILLDAFWESGSWRRGPAIAPDEFDIGKAAGFMFDPGISTHDGAVTRAINAADLIEPRDVAHAFVASLTSRLLEYRSALGSFAFGRWLPHHEPESFRVLLQILGFAGILKPRIVISVFDRFVPFAERRSETELAYPFSAWRGVDGSTATR